MDKKPLTVSCVATLTLLLLSSCTLHYGEQVRTEDRYPELSFSEVKATRFEDAKPSMQIEAAKLEQYKNRSIYARDASFKIWDKNNTIATEGSCTLLGMDSANEIYTMFNSIRIKNSDPNAELYADNLKWNAKTEQLTSGKSDLVRIKQDDVFISGTGFSASGRTKNFSFEGAVSGTVTQDGEEQ